VITHLLDTSALLAHYLDEPGAARVEELWKDRANRVAVCVLTLPELKTRLDAVLTDQDEADRAFRLYTEQLTVPVAVTREVALAAIELRELASGRLPLIDPVIAACAKRESAVLVHRDPHMTAIPAEIVQQLVLPEKTVRPTT